MTRPDRVRLVVLFGGQSAEHEVSCTTAAHVLRAVDPDRYDVVPVGITREGTWVQADDAQAALARGAAALPAPLDRLEATGTAVEPLRTVALSPDDLPVVVLPLLHGPRGEDGTVQGLLELAGVPYVGSGVLASALAMDKVKAKEVLAVHRLPHVAWVALRDTQVAAAADALEGARLGYPVFVKPANLGSSVGVTKVHDRSELDDAVALAATYDEWIVIEEGVTAREIEVAVLGNAEPRASVPGEIVSSHEFYDYEDKYVDGTCQLLVPAPLDDASVAEVRAPRDRRLPGAPVRGHGTRRLLLRGGRACLPLPRPLWPGLPRQRGQHHSGIHSRVDVPEAVGGVGPVVPRPHRRARAPGGRATRAPQPLLHQTLRTT